jgi:hypothetical protein
MDTEWGGQALNSSHMENVVVGNHTNIVRHISSRSVTGRQLPVTIHHHSPYNIEMFTDGSASSILRPFMAERMLKNLCRELAAGGCVNLSSCVYDYYGRHTEKRRRMLDRRKILLFTRPHTLVPNITKSVLHIMW